MSAPTQAGTAAATTYSGGCQCGAVRFRIEGAPVKVGACHCRMCQKATGGPVGIFAVVPADRFRWTRGSPKGWQSSNRASREFCPACGTPLTYRESGAAFVDVLVGCFDEPARVPPTYEVGREAKVAWLASLASLPGKTTLDNIGAERLAEIVSCQHPDHDTPDGWTPPECA